LVRDHRFYEVFHQKEVFLPLSGQKNEKSMKLAALCPTCRLRPSNGLDKIWTKARLPTARLSGGDYGETVSGCDLFRPHGAFRHERLHSFSTAVARLESARSWKVGQFHREEKQLTSIAKSQCGKNSSQRNLICAALVCQAQRTGSPSPNDLLPNEKPTA
jgi:hypothetical protein